MAIKKILPLANVFFTQVYFTGPSSAVSEDVYL